MQDRTERDDATELGEYRLLQRLDGGGRFEFYVAADRNGDGTDRCVVLRAREDRNRPELWPPWADPGVAVLLNHPNIVKMLGHGWAGSWRYFVFEYVDGCDLRQLLGQGSLPRTKAVAVAHEIAQALDYAHRLKDSTGRSLNFVHGALSARNVLISTQGIFKVAGFCLGRIKPEGAGNLSSIPILELAPEELHGLEANPRTDLFHVGLLLFRMLYGHSYVSSTMHRFAQHLGLGALPPITDLNCLADHGLSSVLAKLLAESSADRFDSARSLMNALRAA